MSLGFVSCDFVQSLKADAGTEYQSCQHYFQTLQLSPFILYVTRYILNYCRDHKTTHKHGKQLKLFTYTTHWVGQYIPRAFSLQIKHNLLKIWSIVIRLRAVWCTDTITLGTTDAGSRFFYTKRHNIPEEHNINILCHMSLYQVKLPVGGRICFPLILTAGGSPPPPYDAPRR